jgi:FAD/FMN-containing dehydrogenase
MLPSSPGVIASQTLAGALATGTHGQGLRQASIGDAVLSLRMVLADGSVAEFDRDHPSFPAVQLGLGVLGAVSAVTLRTVPSVVYTCVKDAVSADGLETQLVAWNRDNELSKAWWFPDENLVHVWTAQEANAEELREYRDGGNRLIERAQTSDAMNSTVDQALANMRGDTRITDENGKPYRTVNRFKDFSDVTGDVYQVFCRGIATPQINVEIGVPLDRAGEVVAVLKEWHARTRPHMHYPIILRCTGPSAAWLSPSQGQETVYFGFVVYYAEDGSLSEGGMDFLRAVEEVLATQGGRPHWGKYFEKPLYDWPALYPQWEDFRRVRDDLDPQHRFANAFIDDLFD